MADLAFGAVHTLLGLLRDEAQALVRLGDTVQFIREEMESMNSFLLHLVQTTPPSGEHEGPVRAWMKQVRDLAFDCTNCVDLYVLRGRGSAARDNASSWGFLGRLLSMPCNVPALWARRQAAAQISELKARARDVGERRQRYGVKLPEITAQQLRFFVELPNTDGGGGGDGSGTEAAVSIEDAVAVVSDDFIRRVVLAFPKEPNILEECTQNLVRKLIKITTDEKGRHPIKKVGIVTPDKDLDGGNLARKALEDRSVKEQFGKKVWLTVDYAFLSTMVGCYPEEGAWYVLREILDNISSKYESKTAACRGSWEAWDEGKIAEEITKLLGTKGTRSLIVIEGFHAVKEGRVGERMEHALSKFGCAAGSAVIVITKDIHDANKLNCGPDEIITYSLAYFFYRKASRVVDRGFKERYLKSNILWDILLRIEERCERQAFCMKMFVHYLLQSGLQV